MSKFNTGAHTPRPAVATTTSVMQTTGNNKAPTARTFEGAAAWTRDAKTDLFLRATSSFHGGEDSFYEKGEDRDAKLVELVHRLAIEDPAWVYQFAGWLRGPGNIRTASVMVACEFVKARLDALDARKITNPKPVGDQAYEILHYNRRIIDIVCQRADEPSELLAYWTSRFGRNIPKPVKRGLADAVRRLYNERSLLKYDTASHGYRFADVLELCHPSTAPDKPWQGDLFKYAIDRRHERDDIVIPDSLAMINANRAFRQRATDAPHLVYANDELRAAGLTWENAQSIAGELGVDKTKVWEAMIPNMGYMALLRNLRNFDESGVSDDVADQVIATLQDPEQVARSRQLPFRFYSAYKNTSSDRWARAIGRGLNHCLSNIPVFTGRTLVLVDTSASMNGPMSGKSTMSRVEAAALFGAALALKNPDVADLYQWASTTMAYTVPKGGSVLGLTQHIMSTVGQVGHGTDMDYAIRATYQGHDRVILLSDMQAFGSYRSVGESIPGDVPIYCFNLSAYSTTPMPTGGKARFDLGGMGDATFALIPRLETGRTGIWPWELEKSA